jgi:hypothetical protein
MLSFINHRLRLRLRLHYHFKRGLYASQPGVYIPALDTLVTQA